MECLLECYRALETNCEVVKCAACMWLHTIDSIILIKYVKMVVIDIETEILKIFWTTHLNREMGCYTLI